MLHIDQSVEEATLPSRETMAGDVGLLLGPEAQVLSAEDWKALDAASRALAKCRDGFEDTPPGEGGQAFHNFKVKGAGTSEITFSLNTRRDYDPAQLQHGADIYQLIVDSQIPQILESLCGSPVLMDNFLANVMHKGDTIERHNHREYDFAVVLCLSVPKENTVPLKLERLTASAPEEEKGPFSEAIASDHGVPEEYVMTGEVLLPKQSILILPGDCAHHMDPVSGPRRSIGCFFKKQAEA